MSSDLKGFGAFKEYRCTLIGLFSQRGYKIITNSSFVFFFKYLVVRISCFTKNPFGIFLKTSVLSIRLQIFLAVLAQFQFDHARIKKVSSRGYL